MARNHPALVKKLLLVVTMIILLLVIGVTIAFLSYRHDAVSLTLSPELRNPPSEIAKMIATRQADPAPPQSVANAPLDAQTAATLSTYAYNIDLAGYYLTRLSLSHDGARQLQKIYDEKKNVVKNGVHEYGEIEPTDLFTFGNDWQRRPRPEDDKIPGWIDQHHPLLIEIDEYCQQRKSSGQISTDDLIQKNDNILFNKERHNIYSELVYAVVITQFTDIMVFCNGILAAAGRVESQRGNIAQAEQYYLDSFLYLLYQPIRHKPTSDWCISGLTNLIGSDFKHEIDPVPALAILSQFKSTFMTRKAYGDELIENYKINRNDLVVKIQEHFPTEEIRNSGSYYYRIEIGPIKIPNLTEQILMIKWKLSLPNQLQEYDREFQEISPLLNTSWPQLPLKTPNIPQRHPFWGPETFYTFRGHLESVLTHETQLNLVRAALNLLADPGAAIPPPETDLSGDENNPWRDPFTERPLHRVEMTSGTLIYSLGPDMLDQQGKPREDKMTKAGYLSDVHYDLPIFIPKAAPDRPPQPAQERVPAAPSRSLIFGKRSPQC